MTATLAQIPLRRIDGAPSKLADFAGKVLLVVNVASACGLTPQYAALEAIHEKYGDRGFAVLGFPANEFGAQEPGTNAEIAQFCRTKFGVQFPMFEKIVVKGEGRHPLYAALTQAQPSAERNDESFRERLASRGRLDGNKPDDIMWNFEKFLLSRTGEVVARFAPDVTPDDPMVVAAIEAELAKG